MWVEGWKPWSHRGLRCVVRCVLPCSCYSLLPAAATAFVPQLTAAAEYFGFNEQDRDRYLGGVTQAVFFAVGAPAALAVGAAHRLGIFKGLGG